jgi:DnaJ-class molecular chaperone
VSGQSIVLSGEADFNQETTPGDIIFILTQAPHKTFTRKGHDLAMELTIGLDEAICGFQRPIHHLDGTEIWIESAHNTKHVYSTDDGKGTSRDSVSQSISSPLIIQTGEVQVLKGRGMPKRHQPGEFGDLYIQYRVEMPGAKSADVLTETEKAELSRLLTKLQGTKKQHHHHRRRRKADEDDGGKGPIHTLQAAKAEDFGRSSGKVVLDDDDNSSHSGLHDDHGDEFHPFASGASSFFHSGGTGGTSRFYFGHNSNAFGIGGNQDDDGNVQCQQM